MHWTAWLVMFTMLWFVLYVYTPHEEEQDDQSPSPDGDAGWHEYHW